MMVTDWRNLITVTENADGTHRLVEHSEINRVESLLKERQKEIERLTARNELLEAVVEAAKFAQAVLWGSDGDKKGAIKYLDKALAAVPPGKE